MRILGIDPGLRNTGFGVIEIIDNKIHYISSGIISSNSKEQLPTRLKTILEGLQVIIKEYQPNEASVEKVFVNNNPNSTLLLGQARGIALASCILSNLDIFEYTALQIKKTVTGYGKADKIQICKMVQYLLKLDKLPQKDASDALASAIAHYHYYKFNKSFNNIKSIKHSRLITL